MENLRYVESVVGFSLDRIFPLFVLVGPNSTGVAEQEDEEDHDYDDQLASKCRFFSCHVVGA